MKNCAIRLLVVVILLLIPGGELCTSTKIIASTTVDVKQQTPLKLNLSEYNQTSSHPSLYGSCGHSRYWNVKETPQGIGLVNGRQVLNGEFPWQVALTTDEYFCGGAVVNQNYVLTAGHCVQSVTQPSTVLLVFGGYDLSNTTIKRTGSSIKIHPDYAIHNSISINDLALIKLNSPLSFTSWNIQPICLPDSCDDTCQPGESAVLTGWGLSDNGTQPRYLTLGTLMVLAPSQCASYYLDSYVFQNAICAGTESISACPGDSGGPLACFKNGYFTQMGIVANGVKCTEAMKGPSVFTRVCSFVSWIKSTISQ